jgi:hypothetical protein
MKMSVNFTMFYDVMKESNNRFSYDGLEALFNYIEDLERDLGTDTELDPVAIRSEFTEDDLSYFLDYYDLENIEELESKTTVLKLSDESVIIRDF